MDVLKVIFSEDTWTIENLVDLRDFSLLQRQRLLGSLKYWIATVEEIDQRERESEDIGRE